jgi:hypothetical protein
MVDWWNGGLVDWWKGGDWALNKKTKEGAVNRKPGHKMPRARDINFDISTATY